MDEENVMKSDCGQCGAGYGGEQVAVAVFNSGTGYPATCCLPCLERLVLALRAYSAASSKKVKS